jgi:hypothetical protein
MTLSNFKSAKKFSDPMKIQLGNGRYKDATATGISIKSFY